MRKQTVCSENTFVQKSKIYIPDAVISDQSPIFAIERWNFTQSVE